MPEFVDRCVQSILADQNFQPQEGRTREESAFAICYAKWNELQSQAEGLRERGQQPR
jgi:hypothetical protein